VDHPISTVIIRFSLRSFLFCTFLRPSIRSACSGRKSVLCRGAIAAGSELGFSTEYVRGMVTRLVTVKMKKGKNWPCERSVETGGERKLYVPVHRRSSLSHSFCWLVVSKTSALRYLRASWLGRSIQLFLPLLFARMQRSFVVIMKFKKFARCCVSIWTAALSPSGNLALQEFGTPSALVYFKRSKLTFCAHGTSKIWRCLHRILENWTGINKVGFLNLASICVLENGGSLCPYVY